MSAFTPNGQPFVWIPKEAFDRIEQGLERGQAASAILVYVALCRIASNDNSNSFAKPINYISRLASLERRTIERRLPDLERLGLVKITRRMSDGKTCDQSVYEVTTLSRKGATLSQEGATAPRLHAVAVTRELENKRKEQLTTAQRIGIEHQLEAIKSDIEQLENETVYHWDRTPEKMEKLETLKAQREVLNNRLRSATL